MNKIMDKINAALGILTRCDGAIKGAADMIQSLISKIRLP